MRKYIAFLTAVLFGMVFASMASAATIQQADGGALTADIARAQSVSITGVMIVCGGTACVASIADTATLGGMSNANTVWEGAAAANTAAFFDFNAAPIITTTGSTLNIDTNTTAVVIYTRNVAP